MQKIEAIISSEAISQIQALLENRHISNFMFSNVTAKSTNGAHHRVYRGVAYEVEFDAGVKLEAVVQDDQAMDTAQAILKAGGGPPLSFKPQVLLTPISQLLF